MHANITVVVTWFQNQSPILGCYDHHLGFTHYLRLYIRTFTFICSPTFDWIFEQKIRVCERAFANLFWNISLREHLWVGHDIFLLVSGHKVCLFNQIGLWLRWKGGEFILLWSLIKRPLQFWMLKVWRFDKQLKCTLNSLRLFCDKFWYFS